MYRKIALTSVTLNVAFAFITLFVFVPWLMNIIKSLKVEMPMPIMWLVETSSFVRSPQCVLPMLLLLIGFCGVKAFRNRAKSGV